MPLYLVPTPIGNLKDITYRGVEILQSVDLIFAEDTRKSKVLLQHYGIQKITYPYHQHNEHKALSSIIDRLKSGQSIALITDAGSPGISDPGFLITQACIKEDIEIESLPGATAFVPALILSGFPTDAFVFEGFLPVKKGRIKKLELLAQENRTFILYESPYRIKKTISQLKEYLGEERSVCICRELTKIYEECIRGTLGEVDDLLKNRAELKGEIVIVISAVSKKERPKS